MERLEAAELTALAFHDPKRLGPERVAALAIAAQPVSRDEELALVADARALAEAIDRGQVRRGDVMSRG